MSDPAPALAARAVVIGHGGFAAGLISAVDQITGRGSLLIGISNLEMTPEEMQSVLDRYCEQGIRVVFTDLSAGSATICARRVGATRKGMSIVSGVNLPTLLDFVFGADDSRETVEHAAARGREMIAVIGQV